jgi:hypothetical protein
VSLAILDAWRKRADWTTRDARWRAACWVESGLDRAMPKDRESDFARAAEILAESTDSPAPVTSRRKPLPAWERRLQQNARNAAAALAEREQ